MVLRRSGAPAPPSHLRSSVVRDDPFDTLAAPWRTVFDEAWTSFQAGFAAADEFYRGMDQLCPSFHVTAERQPNTTGPLDGGLARLGRLLPMVFTLRHFPGRAAEQRARAEHPELAATIDRLLDDDEFGEVVRSGSVVEAMRILEL